MLSALKYKFRRIVTGTRNLIAWAPVIWSDRDYDYVYFFRIIDFKLKRMRDHNIKCKYGSHNESFLSIDDARQCISALIKDDFAEAEYAALHAKYPLEGRYKEMPGGLIKLIEMGPDERADFEAVHALEDERRSKCADRLFKILREDYDGWWC